MGHRASKYCPGMASECHDIRLTEWAREQQLQEHRPVVLDQSCDLESERQGTEKQQQLPSIEGESYGVSNAESGHSIRWGPEAGLTATAAQPP